MGEFTRKLIKPFVLTSLLLAILASAMLTSAPARAESTFVAEAIAQAQEAPTDEGKWQVTANVVLTAENVPMMTASGPVSFVKTPDDALWGSLPMKVGDEANDVHRLNVTVMPDGTVGLLWLIAGKPFLGRPTMIFKASSFPTYLSKAINFGGAPRRMVLKLETERVKETSTGNRPPRIRVPKAKEPIGKRYQISARIVVTNSDDGYDGFGKDNTVEVRGNLVLYSWGANGNTYVGTVGKLVPQPLKAGNDLYLGICTIDYIFAKPDTKYYAMIGQFFDSDYPISGPDDMNVYPAQKRNLETHSTFKKELSLSGSDGSESLDVYYKVTFVKDLY